MDIDEARLRFLFGSVPDAAAVEDRIERAQLLMADRQGGYGVVTSTLRMAIADRILGDDPTRTWASAKHLLDEGVDRHEVLDALADGLVPQAEAVSAAMRTTAVEAAPIMIGELRERVTAGVGLDLADPASEHLLDLAEEGLFGDPLSRLALLPPEEVVDVTALTAGIVLTHTLSAQERDAEHLDVEPDLAGFVRRDDLRVPTGALHVDDDPTDEVGVTWGGPAGWLADLPVGALLAVSVSDDGLVDIAAVGEEPEPVPDLAQTLREVYDKVTEEDELPVQAEELVLGVLRRVPDAFARPRPPIAELAAAAGLERRGREFGHDAVVWERAETVDRIIRLSRFVEDEDEAEAAMDAFAVLDGDARNPAELRRVLDLLADPYVLTAVTEELLHPDDGSRADAVRALADRLVSVAGSSVRAAPAHWMAAVAAERGGRVLDAESHLRAAAVVAADWPIVEDRLAWYEADRGDAVGAAARWRGIETAEDDVDLLTLAPFLTATGPEPGRNDPCWCGSGRKYKQCHRGLPAASLAERFEWLQRKAISYLERRGGATAATLSLYAAVLAGVDEDEEGVEEALEDPLLADVALYEGGWFERFLADRGPLLPADEAALAAEWATIRRSVYEVVGIGYGRGVTLRELEGGTEVVVADPEVARTAAAGELLCVRVVPDGGGAHRFAGVVATVTRGREGELRDVLHHGDPLDVLDLLADLS